MFGRRGLKRGGKRFNLLDQQFHEPQIGPLLIITKIVIVNMSTRFVILVLLITVINLNGRALACRVGSEKLKAYTQKSITRLLDIHTFKSKYWPQEPLNRVPLEKVTGLNIQSALTKFSLGGKTGSETDDKLLQDIIVTCSSDKNRLYTLTINLEINNPFKVVQLEYLLPGQPQQPIESASSKTGIIQIHLPQSTLLVQLDQQISYDSCLEVSYVQLAPNVVYDIKCPTCDSVQQKYIDNIFSKKMSQLDSELDPLLSEKISMSLKDLLSQQRLDLDLFMN